MWVSTRLISQIQDMCGQNINIKKLISQITIKILEYHTSANLTEPKNIYIKSTEKLIEDECYQVDMSQSNSKTLNFRKKISFHIMRFCFQF